MPDAPAVTRCDVLVIGAGGAGLRAALAAADAGARVAVLAKSLLGKSQTVMGAALAAALGGDGRDSWEAHFEDTVRGGRGVNERRMAELLAREAPERVRELERWGAVFGRGPAGGIALGEGSGHRHPRLVRAGQHTTGLELLRTLQALLLARGVALHAECRALRLLTDGERVAGALALERASGALRVIAAPAVVLATGGLGKAYTFTSNFHDATGDGYALACLAGASLVDMEFVQFHPTGMVAPASARGLLVAESVRNFGGVLRNVAGERFMFRYVPEGYRGEIAETEAEADAWVADPSRARRPPELLPRDDVSRAIESEIRAGRGTPSGGVLLDIASRAPAELIRTRLAHMHRQFLELADVDITRQAMEVAPTCHYMMGGVRVNAESAAATVPGLFAAGEAAGGLHGANRLNGNGISELLVFGRRAGEHAARFAREQPEALPDAGQLQEAERLALAPLKVRAGEDPFLLLRELQQVMQQEAGLVRSDAGLRRALGVIAELRVRSRHAAAPGGPAANPGWHCVLDLQHLCVAAEAVARSALERRETRGAHVRADCPGSGEAFEHVNIVARMTGEAIAVQAEAREPADAELLSC